MTDEVRAESAVDRARTARFGKLPARVRPDDTVESADTGNRRDRMEPVNSGEMRGVIYD